MAKVPIALRLTPETLAWLDSYARTREASRQQVLEAAVESFRADAEGGVPDLPVVDTPEARVRRAMKAAPVQPARRLSPPDPALLARQRRLNGGR